MSLSRLSNESNNERSPLVSPRQTTDDDVEERRPLNEVLSWEEDSTESKSSWYLFLLTLSIGGLQMVWSVEMSNGSPYLLSLGMSKSLLAFVWIAGPLTGVLVQPYVGIRSDNCRVSWGKRKPYMIGGGAATILALFLLAWIRELVGSFLGLFGVARDSSGTKGTIIIFATISMYILDFSINTVQAGIRAFIVDNAPAHQQEDANAWASRIVGVGNMLGYVFGYIDLPRHFPFLGNSQFKVLCAVASISLGSTLLVSCLYIKERDPRLENRPANDNPGLIDFFKQVFKSVRRLPAQIRKVCEVQFFSWIGWFPFLFYITTYIGQLQINPYLKPELSDDDIEKLWEHATRVGTFALLIYAIVSFFANLMLPFIVEPTYMAKPSPDESEITQPVSPTLSHRSRRSSLGALPFTASTTNLGSYHSTHTTSSKSPHAGLGGLLSRQLVKLRIPHLTLRRTWILSHLFFATCMFSTFFISTPLAATIMTACVGISWSVTLWIPFALISADVAEQDEARREKIRQTRRRIGRQVREVYSARSRRDRLENGPVTPSPLRSHTTPANADTTIDSNTSDDEDEDKDVIPLSKPTQNLLSPPADVASLATNEFADEDNDALPEQHDQAGMILGLHNVAISAPQILATLISSAVFKAMQKDRGVPGDTSVGWVLRIGGVAALAAAWWGRKLGEKTDVEPE